MTTVSIRKEEQGANRSRYRATAGTRHCAGRTAGEALDALLATEGKVADSSTILIQRFVPDAHFTQAQYDRMQSLLARRASLTSDESAELDDLIDTELDATVSRTDALLAHIKR